MATIAEILRDLSPEAADRMKPGSNYVLIPCPFHAGGQERTPSCSVSTEKPVFFCHACKTSGHITQLFRQFGIGQSSAKLLIERAGLRSSKTKKNRAGETVYVDPNEAQNPYRGNFILDEDVLDPYRQAPVHLLRKGFRKDVLWHFEVGYDPVNLRITFPLRNIYGDLVGLSGRALTENAHPRYKIYREELRQRARKEEWYLDPRYSLESVKKALLWHGHLTRPFFAQDEHSWLVLTEGFKACMWVFQAGYQLVNGLIGSYLSKLQRNLITRDVGRVVLFLDNDEAGWEGTYAAAALLEERGVAVLIARYPDDREQPDDLTEDEVLEAIENAVTFIEWRRA